MNKSIYFITGPTGIGKSKLAIKLSEEINGEIINSDSMQIYKELKILSARPDTSDIKKVPHHLYGYVKGNERFNVEKWCSDASKKIQNLHEKNITPIFVGGSGLYIDTIVNGIITIPSIPEEIKDKSKKLFDKIGIKNFFNIVNELDHEAVKKISQNDSQRLKRIWEVYQYTNKKYSMWKKVENKLFINSSNFKILSFLPDREKNYNRVNDRVLQMFKIGAIEEIKELLKLNYKKDLPIMKAHGVPEITSYLKNSISFDECIYKTQLVTRHYVKRQNTWWKSSKLQNLKKFNEFPDQIDLKSTNLANF